MRADIHRRYRTMAFPTPSGSTLTLLALTPLLAWRIRARFRRMVGRQRLSRVRPWITLAIYAILAALLGIANHAQPAALGVFAASLGAGAVLALLGLRRTVFEPTRQGLFYTPDRRLGIALSLLFLGRIAYRLIEVALLDPGTGHGLADFSRSPLTLAVFGLLAGYQLRYAIGLVRWRWRVLAAKRRREAARQDG